MVTPAKAGLKPKLFCRYKGRYVIMTWAADANPSMAILLPKNVRLRNNEKSTMGRF